MSAFRIRLTTQTAARLSKLHPDIKRAIRVGLDDLVADSQVGKPLRDELSGWRSYRVYRFRIIYRVQGREIEVAEIGPRATIYHEMLRILQTRR